MKTLKRLILWCLVIVLGMLPLGVIDAWAAVTNETDFNEINPMDVEAKTYIITDAKIQYNLTEGETYRGAITDLTLVNEDDENEVLELNHLKAIGLFVDEDAFSFNVTMSGQPCNNGELRQYMFAAPSDWDINTIKATITGKGVVASDGNIYKGSVTIPNLAVTDISNPDSPKIKPTSTKAGDTIEADLNLVYLGEDGEEELTYTWVVDGEEIGTGKEIKITEELITEYDLADKQIQVIVTHDRDPELNWKSHKITVKANTTETNNGECNVIVSQGQSFKVTIPAFVSLDGKKNELNENKAEFRTVVVADIAGEDSIEVVPAVMSFKMKESGGIKKDLDAVITGDAKGWVYKISLDDCGEDKLSSDDGVVRNHIITVSNLSAGRWTGTFDWNIITKGEKIDDSEEYVKYKTYRNENGKLVEDVE